jgi:phosphoglycerol transferase MdoB-like AlkP superfamily enzyme
MQNFYAVLWGYKFDFAVSGIIAFIVSLLDFNRRFTAFFGTLVLVSLFAFEISDIYYYYDAARHVGYEILDSVTDASGLLDTGFLQHTLLSVSSLIVAIISIWIFFKVLSRGVIEIKWSRYTILKKIFLLLLTIFFIRGMFNHIPLNPWQSNQIGDAKLASIALNGTYNMLTAIIADRAHLKPVKLPPTSDNNISSLYKGHKKVTATLKRPNIVFFFLESWSMVNLSAKTTPFLYEIMQNSITVKAMIANGHRTTEGIFATLTSFENPLGKSVAKNQLQDFDYASVIDILNADGYESSFFQGTAKETSGTGSLAQKLGFKYSFGKSDVIDRKYGENSWGVYDQDLYTFVEEKLKDSKTPFVIGINGASTHDDKIPQGVKILKLSEDKKYNKILNALHFSDKALREFVQNIDAEYPNTLFVFFADHCGHVEGSAYENHLIPFGLYHKELKAKKEDVILSQRDIAPSVIDLLYGDYRSVMPSASGKSLFSDKNFFAEYFQNGIIGWIEGNNAIEIDISSGSYRCFEIKGITQTALTCKDIHKKLYNNALAFHHISQSLLFKGESKKFSNFK